MYGSPAFERVPFLQTPRSYPPPSSVALFHCQLGTNPFSLMLYCGWFCFYKSAVFGLGFRPSGCQWLAVQPWSGYLPSLCSTTSPGKIGHRLLWISGRINEILYTKNLTQGRIPGACVCGSQRAQILPHPPPPARGALAAGCHLPTRAPLGPRRCTPAQPPPQWSPQCSPQSATLCSQAGGVDSGFTSPHAPPPRPTSGWRPANIWG